MPINTAKIMSSFNKDDIGCLVRLEEILYYELFLRKEMIDSNKYYSKLDKLSGIVDEMCKELLKDSIIINQN